MFGRVLGKDLLELVVVFIFLERDVWLGGFIDSFDVLHELVLGLAAEELARGRRGLRAGEGGAESWRDGVHSGC